MRGLKGSSISSSVYLPTHLISSGIKQQIIEESQVTAFLNASTVKLIEWKGSNE